MSDTDRLIEDLRRSVERGLGMDDPDYDKADIAFMEAARLVLRLALLMKAREEDER